MSNVSAAMINLTYECTQCATAQRTGITVGQGTVRCAGCNRNIPLRVEAIEGSVVQSCVLCGTTDLYVQKDFPHRLGVTIVVLGFLLSSVAWANYWYGAAIGVLMATAMLDLFLYYCMGDVLVCYRCLAQYRGCGFHPRHQAFDLAIGERYRQERLRLAKLRNENS